MAQRKTCLVNGKTVQLSESAFKLAERYFGAIEVEPIEIQPPFELKKPLIMPPKNVIDPAKAEPMRVEARVGKTGEAKVIVSPAKEEVKKTAPKPKTKKK